ncbi:A disintegrin and metalloproteinase with thrombospondin motifs 9-like [Tubulanus polymorphus]|uniref:A disintegrin and metalloproteinase with thrombospondin motifs 9-like n=1 Tax=Tubulanus polymorphus TaxID=672921 RepID=UPI003DA6CB6C
MRFTAVAVVIASLLVSSNFANRVSNQFLFYNTSCAYLKNAYAITADGEYILDVGPRFNLKTRVYCEGMGGSYPREYLTLPAGQDKNYAISRPFNSLQRERTANFSKALFCPNSLLIITNDWLFARTTGQPPSYGKVWGCRYAVGRISIDLTGLPFYINYNATNIAFDERSPSNGERQPQIFTHDCGGWSCSVCGVRKQKLLLDFDACQLINPCRMGESCIHLGAGYHKCIPRSGGKPVIDNVSGRNEIGTRPNSCVSKTNWKILPVSC